MTDYQFIDYRLRCHTKRTDLPAGVLRDIGEAYEEIGRLQKERNEPRKDRAAYRIEIDRLIGQRDEARRDVCDMMHITGFLAGDYAASRGWDCFPDMKRNVSEEVKNFRLIMERDYAAVVAQRDEARREILESLHPDLRESYAAARGWDCFKENTND